jgi:hypothetical protein
MMEEAVEDSGRHHGIAEHGSHSPIERLLVISTLPHGTVRVEIELPWVMQFLRNTIHKTVRGRGVALLEKPPSEP